MNFFNRLKNKFRDMKLRTKFLISYIILIAIPAIITGYFYYNTSSSIIIDSARQNIFEIAKKNDRIIDLKLSQIEESSNNLILDNQLFNIFNKKRTEDEYDLLLMDRHVQEVNTKYFSQYSDILSMFIVTSYFQFGNSDFTFIAKDRITNTELYQEAINSKGRLKWIPTYNVKKMFQMDNLDNIYFQHPYMFSAVKQLNLTTINAVGRIGNIGNAQSGFKMQQLSPNIEKPVLIINFNNNMFKKLYSGSIKYSDAYNIIIDKNGNIVYETNETGVGKISHPIWLKNAIKNKSGTDIFLDKGEKILVCYDTLNTNNWVSAIIVPVDSLLKELPIIRYYSLFFALTLMFIAITFAFVISGWIVKPLKKLLAVIKKMGEGDFDHYLVVPSNDEIGLLVNDFNDMNDKIQQLIRENYETKIRENEANLMALNLQLNPHFLSNTLNIINWMAIENKQTDISKMIISLSQMLEYTLRHNDEIVCFENDFDWLKNYIFIMSNRFYGVFVVHYYIDPLLNKQKVPKLFMQTFVENSIIHGFEAIQSGGELTITGIVDGNLAKFIVEDNGKGMSKQEIEKAMTKDGSRIGIKNIDKRIKLIFGVEYGVVISSEEEIGTKITILFPLTDNA